VWPGVLDRLVRLRKAVDRRLAMGHKLLDIVEKPFLKAEPPEFQIGDTVDVYTRIIEGDRERTQIFNGVVIATRGRGINKSFTVRRIVANEGVERKFLLHSPRILKVDVKRHGKVRRAKLYFLRDRVGKSRRLREKRRVHTKTSGASAPTTPVKPAEPQTPEPVEVVGGSA
jgi:large subunit ribosomal protein L19